MHIMLLHGFGAPGDDLVGLADELHAPAGAEWVFPAAPLAPPQLVGGRAWWMLDLDALERAVASGRPRDLTDEDPVGLPDARAHVMQLIHSLDGDRLVLGGFSQGAMLACEVALHLAQPPVALVLLSGAPVHLAAWRPLLPRLAGVPVFQSHGDADTLLSFAAAERLRAHLTEAGAVVEWVPFHGGHEIPPVVINRLNAFLARIAA